MSKHALINPQGAIVREDPTSKIDPEQIAGTGGLRTGYKWLPIVEERVSTATQGNEKVRTEGPVETIEADRVLRVWTTRDMTAQELDADKERFLDGQLEAVQWKAIFLILNEAREGNGKRAITAQQFRTWVKEQL